jgi:hypothetical protein
MSAQPTLAAEANRLYWETETSVADTAEQLNLSRRALYDMLRPSPTGARCPSCDGEMAYENRSARTAKEAKCTECGARATDTPEPETPPQESAAPAIDPQKLLLGGAMMAGALIGVVATLVTVRRR